jgi:hypothetical protein
LPHVTISGETSDDVISRLLKELGDEATPRNEAAESIPRTMFLLLMTAGVIEGQDVLPPTKVKQKVLQG